MNSRHAIALVAAARAALEDNKPWNGRRPQESRTALAAAARVARLCQGRDVTMSSVRGHAGDVLNKELIDWRCRPVGAPKLASG